MNECQLTSEGQLKLTPRRPPGRTTRKALSYASEIRRLREEGYALQAIREALADVGIVVSSSTVWREANRPTSLPSPAPSGALDHPW